MVLLHRSRSRCCIGQWANLASILTAVSGIETYLRSEHSATGKERLVELINQASLDDKLKNDLHTLRTYGNKWVHIDDPWDDADLSNDRKILSSSVNRWHSLRLTRCAELFVKIRGYSISGNTSLQPTTLNWVDELER
jgi:hypothetical protein